MEIQINGKPGSQNRYDDVHIYHVGNLYPNAESVNVYNQISVTKSRLSIMLCRLSKEYRHHVTQEQMPADVMRYRRKRPHSRGLVDNLKAAHYSRHVIEQARLQERDYTTKATQYQSYISAQRVDSYLFAALKNRFYQYVYPLIEAQQPQSVIRTAVYERVILPVMSELNATESSDTVLYYNEDDLFGMLYYLTNKGHILWTLEPG